MNYDVTVGVNESKFIVLAFDQIQFLCAHILHTVYLCRIMSSIENSSCKHDIIY